MKEHGGKYLAGGYDKTVGLSGAAPQNRVVLIQFPDMDAAKAFYGPLPAAWRVFFSCPPGL
jgi:uncharacterized protein (DUF1330 family)